MKLIQLKCPSCGNNLDVLEEIKEIKCQYCRSIIHIDDEIIKVEHTIKNDVERKFKSAEVYLNKLKDYEKAFNLYIELSDDYPDDARCWMGLILSLTNNFNVKFKQTSDIADRIKKYYNNYLSVEVNDSRKKQFVTLYENYIMEVVTPEDSIEKKRLFKEAESLIELDCEKAQEAYLKLLKEYPNDSRSYWGMIMSISEEFTNFMANEDGMFIVDYEELDRLYEKYLELETDEEIKGEFVNRYEVYKRKVEYLTDNGEQDNNFDYSFVKWVIFGLLFFIIIVILLLHF